MKRLCALVASLFAVASPAFASVTISSPTNGSSVTTNVSYSASATTNSCSAGVASMGVYVDNVLKYVSPGSSLKTTLPVSQGTHSTVVEEWDHCGGATYSAEQITASGQSGVTVRSPTNGSTVTSAVTYQATASSSCAAGIASMGVYVNNQLVYVSEGSTLNTALNLSSGPQSTVVEEWDRCGGASYSPVNVTVTGGTTLSNLQAKSGWVSYGEFAPTYDICSSSCSGVTWSQDQHVSSPSMSGNATEYKIGGSVPYSDVLWTNALIGDETTQGIPDKNHTLLPSLHNFTYDTYVFVTDLSITQSLEFDISMYMNGTGMIWGQQCDHLADGDWDIWDNVRGKWVSSGIACKLNNNAWNHITIQVEREDNNTLVYKSITVNGTTSTLNRTYAPYSVPSSWWGLTVNYQMDGDHIQAANTTYLDDFNLTYW